ncbi:MAG: nucleotidyl transferase AbiEii/AbiGii toxin family protein [Candidatus Omnitrophica bacterium]|nr:nucleotidyl transferase AbiEii/AbiGii toxin family protein [Candidatus Omnitrophota bacterium]
MLDIKQIESFYPENLRPFRQNLLREYFQYKLLEIIYDSPWAGRLAFMGGTCLRIVHGMERFSEDVDFDNLGLNREDFEALSLSIHNQLGLLGYQAEVKTVFAGAFRCSVRISNVLYDTGLSGHKKSKILIQVDTEPQMYSYRPQEKLLNKFDIFLRIKAVPPEILLAQKIYAILNRPRTMGRDFYDTVFLLGRVKPDYGYLKVKAGIAGGVELRERLLTFCEQVDLQLMGRDVRPFLMSADDVKKVVFFKDYITGCEL